MNDEIKNTKKRNIWHSYSKKQQIDAFFVGLSFLIRKVILFTSKTIILGKQIFLRVSEFVKRLKVAYQKTSFSFFEIYR